jgi:hypothetical protein
MKELFVVVVYSADSRALYESDYYEAYPAWEAVEDELHSTQNSNYAIVEKRYVKEEN